MKKNLITLMAVVLGFGMVFGVASATPGNNTSKNNNKNNEGSCTTIQSGELLASDGSVITTGYDQWGYNYQARMFNGKYCDAYRDADWCQPYVDDKLMMKWNDAWLSNKDCDGDGLLDRHYGYDSYIGSGAWLTNHQSGEYETYDWDVSGDWVISVNNGAYKHDYTFTMTSIEDGTFTGVGGYPAGSDPYLTEEIVINGQIIEDTVKFTAKYVSGYNQGYEWEATGTIDESGQMSGVGTSGVNEWHTTSGAAQKISETCKWNYFVKIVAAPADAKLSDDGVWYNADGNEIGPAIWGQFAIIQEVSNDSCAGEHGSQYLSPARAGLGNW